MSITDYTPYLRVTADGWIWWLHRDAIRLGAGFLPVTDDPRELVTELRAPSKLALANERTLIGAFSDVRLSIERPATFDRDGVRYVEATGFLNWLAQYITLTQAKITFPTELADAVIKVKTKEAAARPRMEKRGFASLTLALEKWFDTPLDQLPVALRQRVENEFSPMPWDDLSADRRRSVTLQLDYQHDPATEQDRKYWRDFYEGKNAIIRQIAEWKAVATPTAGDLAKKEVRLTELEKELAGMEYQEQQARGDYYPGQISPNGEDEGARGESTSCRCKPVSALLIKQHFQVSRDVDANFEWWKEKMRDAKRYGLAKCRVGTGKRGPGGSLWRPDLVAGWLMDRHAKGIDGLDPNASRLALKKFPGCTEAAEDILPSTD